MSPDVRFRHIPVVGTVFMVIFLHFNAFIIAKQSAAAKEQQQAREARKTLDRKEK